MQAEHLNMEQLQAGVDHIRRSPADQGVLQLIARRPDIGKRELLREGQLDPGEGLVGDNWKTRGAASNPPREPNPLAQLTIMNARAADLVATCRERWPLAGDQLYIDLDLSLTNLPAGTKTVHRLRRHPGHRRTSHRLQEIRRALRPGRHAPGQWARGPGAVPARHQHAGSPGWRHPPRRRGGQAVSTALTQPP